MKKLFLLLTIILCFTTGYSQGIRSKIPYSDKNVLELPNIPIKELPELDLATLLIEDEQELSDGVPPRFGYSHEVEYNLLNSGIWETLTNGDRIWFLKITCPNATSINLLYDKFWIPEGSEFCMYNVRKGSVLGIYTNRNSKGDRESPKGYATGLVFNETIILEYFEPKSVSTQGIISINRVVHGYRNLLSEIAGFGGSGNCQVNINCDPEGNEWQNEKQSVAMILVDGYRICTGSLMNTANLDGAPIFLTADHCIYESGGDAISDPELTTYSFWWNYESSGCADGIDFVAESTAGATVLANNTETDFAILELDEDPREEGYEVYYNGWHRGATQPANGVGIHHPMGDIKKISTHDITPDISDCMDFSFHGSYLSNNSFWKINWMETTNGWSVTESGSSGSPLYTSDHRVIGQLFGPATCPNPNCSDPEDDIANYGRIFSSWNMHITEPRRRLRDWLDQNNILTELPGLRIISDATITTTSSVDGDIVLLENVTVPLNTREIDIDYEERVEITGGFRIQAGTLFSIQPQ